jgi:minor fimbrial subunit
VGTSSVTALFTGTADTTGYYKNQGTASNIQLQIQDTDGVTLNNNTKKTTTVDETTSSGDLELRVRALSVNGNATIGSIQAVIDVTYTYS